MADLESAIRRNAGPLMPSAYDVQVAAKRFDVDAPASAVLIGTLQSTLPVLLSAYNCNARERFEDELRDLTAAVLIFAAICRAEDREAGS